MDLVADEQRDDIFNEREEDLKKLSLPLDCTCYRTSIWDETLYRYEGIKYFLKDCISYQSLFILCT